MIKELQKRPFVRPLLVWGAGIVLQSCFAVRGLSFGLLVIPLAVLLFPRGLLKRQKPEAAYRDRWVWGGVFVPLLLFLSIQTTGYHENQPSVNPPNKLQVKANEIQRKLLQPVAELNLTEAEKAVLSTITLGDKESMPKETRQQFSMTGVAHILAVSGFHVAVVCGLLSALLSFLSVGSWGRRVKYLSVLVLLWAFTVVSGLSASAVRAAIMLSLYLTGRQFRRTTDSYNTLAASAFCMLVYDPFYLFDIGFQLSYIAVFSIVYLQPVFSSWIDVKNPILKKVWDSITVTLAAQTGVTIICLYYFRQSPTLFLFTNLPVALLASALIPAALIWLICPAWLPGMQGLQHGIEVLTHAMVRIVDAFSRVPGGSFTLHLSFQEMLLAYLFLFILLLYYKKHGSKSLLHKKIVHLEPKS